MKNKYWCVAPDYVRNDWRLIVVGNTLIWNQKHVNYINVKVLAMKWVSAVVNKTFILKDGEHVDFALFFGKRRFLQNIVIDFCLIDWVDIWMDCMV